MSYDDPIVKLGMSCELYDKICYEVMEAHKYMSFHTLSEPNILGVIVVPRDRKNEF